RSVAWQQVKPGSKGCFACQESEKPAATIDPYVAVADGTPVIEVASASELKSPTQMIGRPVPPGPARNSLACSCWATPEIGSRWVDANRTTWPPSITSTDAHAQGSA